MRAAPCWLELGLEPTDDRKAIRRAYAARLKAMDIEADPAGYQALRDARDAALRHVEGAAEQVVPNREPTPALEDGAEVSAEPSLQVFAPDEVQQWLEQLREDTDAIASLLEGASEQQRYLLEDEADEVLVRFDRVARNPLAANVDILAQGSEIFADLIARNIPQSDLLIGPASQLFGWSQADELSDNYALTHVLQRARDLQFASELADPSHKLHKAWVELCTPADEHSRRGWFIRAARVQELLQKVRGSHPSLEDHFDSWRVSLWENKGTGSKRTAFLAVWIGLIIIKLWISSLEADRQAARKTNEPTPAVLVPPLGTMEQEWARAIGQWENPSLADSLKGRNPGLYSLFATNWQQAKLGGDDSQTFQQRMFNLTQEQLQGAWSYASADLLRRRAALERDTARTLLSRPMECAFFLKGESFVGEERFRKGLTKLEGDLLLEVDPKRPVPERRSRRSFAIPGTVVEAAVREGGLTNQEMVSALQLRGSDEGLCRGRVALLEALLGARPATSTPVLRNMFGAS